MQATLARAVRQCASCGDDYTPTTNAQRYCSGRCSERERKKKTYVANSAALLGKRRLRLHAEEYDALLAAQGGRCAICRGSNGDSKLCVDHCHTTGRVRGLLCHRCNTALGLLKDDPGLLAEAIRYLGKYETN